MIWAAPSEFVTYRLCEQRRFRRACASAQSRQNLRCSLIQTVSQEEPSDRKPDPLPLWMAGHAQLRFVMTECSKTQIRLTGLISAWSENYESIAVPGGGGGGGTGIMTFTCNYSHRLMLYFGGQKFEFHFCFWGWWGGIVPTILFGYVNWCGYFLGYASFGRYFLGIRFQFSKYCIL